MKDHNPLITFGVGCVVGFISVNLGSFLKNKLLSKKKHIKDISKGTPNFRCINSD